MTRTTADIPANARWALARWTAVLNALVVLAGPGCDGAAPETPGAEEVEVARSALTSGPTKINAGGSAVSGTSWVVDQEVSGGSQTTTTNSITLPADLVNPAPTTVYKSARITQSGTTTPFTYTLPGFAAGSYNTVRLHFAEWTATAPGQRVFNVTVNGAAALTNLDVYVAAAGRNRAVIKEFTGQANMSGQYVITFTPVVGKAVVSGVEIVASNLAQPTRIHAGGGAYAGFAQDVGFSGGSAVTNTRLVDTSGVTHAAPRGLYQTGRSSTTNFTYTVPGFAAGSQNNVRLHFAETAKTAAGQRVFNVTINGTQMLSNFDIFAAAGGSANRAIVKEFRLAADSNGRYVIRFDKVTDSALVSGIEVVRGVPWFTRTNMSPADFSTEFNARAAAGYRMTTVSAYRSAGSIAFAGVWDLTPGPGYYVLYDMSKAQFDSQNAQMIAGGWTLSVVNGYDAGGVAKYVALWTVRSAPPPMITKVEMDYNTFINEFNTQVSNGYVMTHLAGYNINGQNFYLGEWEQRSSPGWYAYIDQDPASLTSMIANFQSWGFRMVDVSGYNAGSGDLFTVIFEATAGPPTAEYHIANATIHTKKVDDLHRQGFTPTVISAFPTPGSVEHYATLWRNDNYSAADLAAIDNLANNILTTNALPSLSLAMSKDGRLVFAKAYGQVDGVLPHVSHRYRIASVSKSITSAGIMRAIDEGLLNLDHKVFGTGAVLGTLYGTPPYPAGITAITIRQLLSHTSGFDESLDPFTPGITQLQFMNTIVNTTPPHPNGTYTYSNSDYIILARVLEKIYGGSSWKVTDPPTYAARIAEHVLAPAGVQTMDLGYDDLANRETDEVTYSPSGAYQWNMRNMDGSSAWVATPIDLLRFTTHVDGLPSVPDVLGPAVEQRMYDYTVTCASIPAGGSCYALGWLVTDRGQRWHNGMVTGTWAMLQQMNGLDMAIVTNDTTQGSFPFWTTGDDIAGAGVNWTTADFFDSPN